jgi:predicted CoA-binding protein
MQRVKEAAAAFLTNKRVAVTGMSRTPKGHGSNVVYQRLRERGYEVFAVNPNARDVEGDRCDQDLKSIPGGVQAVVIDGGCPLMFGPTADFGHRIMRFMLAGHVPKQV